MAAGINWIYACLFVLMKFDSIGVQGLFFLQFMSITGSFTAVSILYKFIPASIDLICMNLIGVRIVITFMLFNLVGSKDPAFQSIDKK